MPTIEEVLTERMQRYDGAPAFQLAKTAIDRTFAAKNDFRAKAEKIANNKHLTPVGKQDALRKYVAEKAHELHRATKSVETMRAKLSERRAKMQPPPPDPTNVAAAVLRSEMRTLLRGIPNISGRMAMVLAPNADPVLLQAVLEAPNAMSGLNDQARELITAAVIEKYHPGKLAELERDEEAVELVNTVNRVLVNTVRDAAEFPNDDTLVKFVQESVGETGALDADVERNFAALADVPATT